MLMVNDMASVITHNENACTPHLFDMAEYFTRDTFIIWPSNKLPGFTCPTRIEGSGSWNRSLDTTSLYPIFGIKCWTYPNFYPRTPAIPGLSPTGHLNLLKWWQK